jgi:transposase
MKRLYNITLTEEECQDLHKLISVGKHSAQKLAHARILLKADTAQGQKKLSDEAIAQALEVGTATVFRVRRRFVEAGLEAALNPQFVERHHPPKVDGVAEAHLVALVCGPVPQGHDRWSLRLLAEKMVELEYIDSLSHEMVRRVLKKMNLSLG